MKSKQEISTHEKQFKEPCHWWDISATILLVILTFEKKIELKC